MNKKKDRNGLPLRKFLKGELSDQGIRRHYEAAKAASTARNLKLETLHLLSIPGMRKSIVKGKKTPVSKCATKVKW